MILKKVGFGFIILGLVWALFNHSLCKGICEKCGDTGLSPCFFLLMFSGIVFVISGTSLVINLKEEAINQIKKRKK
jgi:hypothetical protein